MAGQVIWGIGYQIPIAFNLAANVECGILIPGFNCSDKLKAMYWAARHGALQVGGRGSQPAPSAQKLRSPVHKAADAWLCVTWQWQTPMQTS